MARRPHQVVGPAHDPYLLRWFLLPRNRFVNVYLQTFTSSELLNSARALSAREFVQQLDVPSHDIGDIGIIQKHTVKHTQIPHRGELTYMDSSGATSDSTWRRVTELPRWEVDDASEFGYEEQRLCDTCATAYFGFAGPEDSEKVGLHGGDMCVSCGYQPPDCRHMACTDIASVLCRAAEAGAGPDQLRALCEEALRAVPEFLAEMAYKVPDWGPAATWPARW